MALLQCLAHDAAALVARLSLLLTPTTAATAAPVASCSTCGARQLRTRPHTAVTPGVRLSPSCRGDVREQLQLVHKHLAAAHALGGCSCSWRLLLLLAAALAPGGCFCSWRLLLLLAAASAPGGCCSKPPGLQQLSLMRWPLALVQLQHWVAAVSAAPVSPGRHVKS
ncbi:unnamed protein product [Closterium sp. Naga37s-1]|nr:unnamed protein product [Closterium sp. Naga37s-1]